MGYGIGKIVAVDFFLCFKPLVTYVDDLLSLIFSKITLRPLPEDFSIKFLWTSVSLFMLGIIGEYIYSCRLNIYGGQLRSEESDDDEITLGDKNKKDSDIPKLLYSISPFHGGIMCSFLYSNYLDVVMNVLVKRYDYYLIILFLLCFFYVRTSLGFISVLKHYITFPEYSWKTLLEVYKNMVINSKSLSSTSQCASCSFLLLFSSSYSVELNNCCPYLFIIREFVLPWICMLFVYILTSFYFVTITLQSGDDYIRKTYANQRLFNEINDLDENDDEKKKVSSMSLSELVDKISQGPVVVRKKIDGLIHSELAHRLITFGLVSNAILTILFLFISITTGIYICMYIYIYLLLREFY
jgi:hypothetical protein